jgi:hypothetical protein
MDSSQITDAGGCAYTVSIYPSRELKDSYYTNVPAIYTAAIGLVFLIMIVTFIIFNRFIHKRNRKVVAAAVRSRTIVAAMFPSNVRRRLFEDDDLQAGQHKLSAKSNIRDFLSGNFKGMDDPDGLMYTSKPVADFFPEVCMCTCRRFCMFLCVQCHVMLQYVMWHFIILYYVIICSQQSCLSCCNTMHLPSYVDTF